MNLEGFLVSKMNIWLEVVKMLAVHVLSSQISTGRSRGRQRHSDAERNEVLNRGGEPKGLLDIGMYFQLTHFKQFIFLNM